MDPIFDPRTGSLGLDGFDLVISPALTRAAFEAHPDVGRFTVFVRNEPYCSFRTRAEIRGEPFHVVLWFYDMDGLWRLTLGTGRREIVGADWSDYDLPASVDLHEQWLDEALGQEPMPHPRCDPQQPYVGPVRRPAWATAGVATDPHNGTSEIVIDYRERPG